MSSQSTDRSSKWLEVAAAIILNLVTGWLFNRGPKEAARTFGLATAGVLLPQWAMVIGTIWMFGFHLPIFHLSAFSP